MMAKKFIALLIFIALSVLFLLFLVPFAYYKFDLNFGQIKACEDLAGRWDYETKTCIGGRIYPQQKGSSSTGHIEQNGQELSEPIEHGDAVFRYGIERYTDANKDTYGKMPGLLMATKKSTGQTMWDFRPSTRVFQPIVDYDVVLVRTTGGQLFILDRESGKVLWERSVEPSEYFQAFDLGMKYNYYFFGSLLIVPGEHSAYSKYTGDLVWRYRGAVNVENKLIDINHIRMVYQITDARNYTNELLSLETSTGKVLWQRKIGVYERVETVHVDGPSLILLAESDTQIVVQTVNVESGMNVWKKEYPKNTFFSVKNSECHVGARAEWKRVTVDLLPILFCPDPGSYASVETLGRTLYLSVKDGREM